MGRIFISHQNNPADNAWAAKVHAWIKDQKGICGFLDFDVEDGIKAGEEWEKKIYAAMNAAQVVIAIVSKDWLESSWCMSEARMARLLGRKLILVITEKCEVPFRATQSIRLAKHGEERAFEELLQALRATHNPPEYPYPGLVAFEEKDAAVFFGREDETRKLENQLDRLFRGRPKTERLLLLLGASGSGKSSLMRAGLIPRFNPDPTHHAIRPIIPRGDPLKQLGKALGVDLRGLSPEAAAAAILKQVEKQHPGSESILLSIDQAEELLQGDQTHFFEVLRAVLELGDGEVVALMAMRSDFLNVFQQSGLIGTGTPLPYDTFTLDPLPRDRLSDIIQKPADLYGVSFEEGLVARIMDDHGGEDALPLLAFFLNEFWRPDYIGDGILQLPEYEHSGGIGQALVRAVDAAIDRCRKVSPQGPDAEILLDELRELFLGHLVTVSAGSDEAVRRRASADRLTDRQVALLQAFAQERLLIEREATWEVVHEALLRQWEGLSDWIAEAREDLVAINRIEDAAARWSEADRQEADLTHSGNRLAEARDMLNTPLYADRFDETVTEYLTACHQKESDLYEKEKALREAAERARDRAEAQRAAAEIEARRALKNHRLGLAALSFSELQAGRPAEAVMLALAAWPRRPDPADNLKDYWVALDALSTAAVRHREIARLSGHEGPIFSVTYSADGTRLATRGKDGAARLWDTQTGAQIGKPIGGPDGEVRSVAFSPGSTLLATAGSDGTARLWDARSGTQIGPPMTGHEDMVDDIAFSPSGTLLATGGKDGTARLWDVRTGNPIGKVMGGHDDGVDKVIFSSNGKRLVTIGRATQLWDMETGTPVGVPIVMQSDPTGRRTAFSPNSKLLAMADYMDRGVGLWDAQTGERIEETIGLYDVMLTCFTFSPDGTRLAMAGHDGTVRLWDMRKRSWISEKMAGHGFWVDFVAFSPDGTRLATAGEDGTTQLWDAKTGRPIGPPMTGHQGNINDISFSPDGARLATASNDGTARLWDTETGNPIVLMMTGHNATNSLAFSPDLSILATVVQPRMKDEVQLWNAEARTPIGRTLRGIRGGVVTVLGFSPDGARLAMGSKDGAVNICKVTTGAPIVTITTGDESGISKIAFSPDGRLLATAGRSGMQLWDAETGSPIGALETGHGRVVYDIAFSPDGARLATAGGGDGTTRLWDTETGSPIGAPVTGHGGAVKSVAFSPDGTRFATAGHDDTARLWDAETGNPIGKPMANTYGGIISSVAFSPDGLRLATAGSGGTVQLWDTATGNQIVFLMTGHAGTIHCLAFSPDGKRLAVMGDDAITRLYDVSTGIEIARLKGHLEGREKKITIVLKGVVAFSSDGKRLGTAIDGGSVIIWNIDYGSGNSFEVLCRRLPTRDPPAILETYGIELDEPICSGEEPMPFPIEGMQ